MLVAPNVVGLAFARPFDGTTPISFFSKVARVDT